MLSGGIGGHPPKRRPVSSRNSGDHYDGGDAAGTLLYLALIWPFKLLEGLIKAISVLPSLVVWVAIQLRARSPELRYSAIYHITVTATRLFFIATGVLAMLVWLLLPQEQRNAFIHTISELLSLQPTMGLPCGLDPNGLAPKVTPLFWQLWVPLVLCPGLAFFALVVRERLRPLLTGFGGFAYAYCTAFPAVLVGIYLPASITLFLFHWLKSHPDGLRTALVVLFQCCAVAGAYTLLAALLVGAVLWAVARAFTGERIPYHRACAGAMFAVSTHLLVSLTLTLFLAGTETVLHQLSDLSHLVDLALRVERLSMEQWGQLGGWLLFAQLPGLLLGSGAIATHVRGSYQGGGGFIRACFAAGLGIWLAVGSFVALGLLFSGGLPETRPKAAHLSDCGWTRPVTRA